MNARFLLVPAALLCATASLATATSAAAGQLHAPQARVSFADLNLASASGRATLERRVNAAAEQLCLVTGVTDLRTQRAGRDCYAATVDRAMAQVEVATNNAIQFAAVQGSAAGR